MDAKDEFGVPIFSSRQEVVTEAVRELLRKYRADIKRSSRDLETAEIS
jgi:Arc/MetJ-type ribon-helix-helix transcriptional regulator